MKKFQKFCAFALASLMMLTACSGKSEQGEAPTNPKDDMSQKPSIERLANKEEFIFACKVFDGNFDPCTGWGQYGTPLMQSKLMNINSTSLEKDLATDYKVSEDGLTWTFTIRDDVKFHDGEKLTAKDVAFTYNNTKEIGGKVDLTTMDKAVAIDDTTVEFKMNTPFSSFLYNTAALGIVPEHAYGDSASYSKNPIGSGPLKFVQYDEGQQLIMERNDDYYGEKSNFKKVVMLMMNADAAFAAVKAGNVDLAITNQALAQSAVDGYSVKEFETYDYRVISFPDTKPGGKTEQGDPMGNAVTSDVAIRKALSIGIDRNNMVENVLNGYGEPTFDVFSKFPWGLGEEVKSLKDNDKEAAKKILEEAGWKLNSEGIREKDGVKAEFDLMYGITALDRQAIALSFAEEAKELGIIVTPKGLDWSEIEKNAKTQPMVLGGGQYNPMNISRLFSSKYANQTGWANVVGYNNPKTDEYMQKAIESIDEKAANEYWKKSLWDGEFGPSAMGDNVYIPVCYLEHLFFVRDGVSLGADIVLPHDHGPGVMGDVVHWDYNEK
ncbi:MAG: ABC transporter substrate-binding protein [Peptostreptococcaceae bacterium]|nr:ABC transporter substrate-binding protein [Peptostreptococcaceae bacterium]